MTNYACIYLAALVSFLLQALERIIDMTRYVYIHKLDICATLFINIVILIQANSAIYLGITLDSKLNWNMNTQSRITKAETPLYYCKEAVDLNCGINPKNV